MRDIGITKSSRYRVLKWDIRLRRAKVYFAGEKGKGTKASYTEFLDEQGAELVEKLTDNPNVIVVGAKVGIPDEVITYVSGGTKEVDEFIINEDQFGRFIRLQIGTLLGQSYSFISTKMLWKPNTKIS